MPVHVTCKAKSYVTIYAETQLCQAGNTSQAGTQQWASLAAAEELLASPFVIPVCVKPVGRVPPADGVTRHPLAGCRILSWLSSRRSSVETGLTVCRRRDEKAGVFSLQVFFVSSTVSLSLPVLNRMFRLCLSPLQHIKNSADTNKFDGWPDVLEMEGCVPQRAGWWSGEEKLYTLFPQSVRPLPALTSCIGHLCGSLTLLWATNHFKKKKTKKKQPTTPNSQCSAACSVGTAAMQMRGRRGDENSRCLFCSSRSVPRRSCNTELIGRLHWCEEKGLVIYPRAVTTVMVLSYCTAVHEWLNPWRLVCCARVRMRLFFLKLSHSSIVLLRAHCK